MWLSLVEHLVRDEGVAGSNPATPTNQINDLQRWDSRIISYTPMGGGHPSDTLAALISSAEIAGRSGRDLVTATALSYEVFCKVADVLDSRGLGLDQSTILGLASVVGASRLMGLTPEQMVCERRSFAESSRP